jgi:hypothetical protein
MSTDEQGDDVTARHESGTGVARAAGRPVLRAAVLGLILAGAAACGNGDTGSDTLAAATPTSVASSAPTTEAPSPEATATETPAATKPAPTATGPIVILSPAEGSGVSRTFVVTGKSVSFEGTIVWQLRKAGTAVATGTAQGGAESSAPYEFTVKAPAAGTYTVRVFEESAKDGSAVNEVTRKVVVS